MAVAYRLLGHLGSAMECCEVGQQGSRQMVVWTSCFQISLWRPSRLAHGPALYNGAPKGCVCYPPSVPKPHSL